MRYRLQLWWVSCIFYFFFFSSRRRHTRCGRDWSSDVCSSDLHPLPRWTRALYRLIPQQMSPVRREPEALTALACSVVGEEELEIGRASCRERVWISVVAVS